MGVTTQQESIIVAVTGASGAPYALRLIQRLAMFGIHQHLLLSDAARVVLKQEVNIELPDDTESTANAIAQHLAADPAYIHCYDSKDWFSPAASGSAGIQKMVIIPCSMGTLSRVATGASDNLIERAADVMLKEKRQLIMVPRETPLSSIHLENMLRLSQMGVSMIPAMPAFYHQPQSIAELVDFLVDRVLDHLGVANPEAKRWGI